MAGAAGLLVDDTIITDGFVRALEHIRDLQGPEGQIVSNYELPDGGAARVSFGTLAPRIDAVTWYLVGVALGARANVLDPSDFSHSVRAAIRLLAALEYNGRHLIYVPRGGNWADEYPWDGYVLYDQVLRAWAMRMLAPTYDEPDWAGKAALIERTIEINYWPGADDRHESRGFHSPIIRTLIDPDRMYPVASFSPCTSWSNFDLAACSLLAVAGIAPALASDSLDWIVGRFLDRSELPPALHPVIEETDEKWPALRQYHLYEFRNLPHEYHNGGIWPIWLGWLALALAATGRMTDLHRLRDVSQARFGMLPHFQFEEFLHGSTGIPGGQMGMAYSATGIVFLEAASRRDRLSRLMR